MRRVCRHRNHMSRRIIANSANEYCEKNNLFRFGYSSRRGMFKIEHEYQLRGVLRKISIGGHAIPMS